MNQNAKKTVKFAKQCAEVLEKNIKSKETLRIKKKSQYL